MHIKIVKHRVSLLRLAKKMHQKPDDIDFLCFNLAKLQRSYQFVILTALTFVFFLLYGFLLELIYKLPGFSEHSTFLTLVQFFLYTCFSFTERNIRNDLVRKIPIKIYFLIALLTVVTMGLSNASVSHLNYPTQVMFKCCKLIPVLLGGIIIQGKKFNVYDVSASILMSIGLIFFTLADIEVQPNFEAKGVLLILGALMADAAIGNVQEKQMKLYKASNIEVVFYSYSIGFVYIFIFQMCFENIPGALLFWLNHPIKTFGYAFIFSITGYLGINIVLHLVKNFGALIAVTVTTCRKAVTIIVSFIFFTKPFTYQYLWSGLFVLIGIYFNMFSKNRQRWEAVAVQLYELFSNYIDNKNNRMAQDSIA